MERIYSEDSMIGGIKFSKLKLIRIDQNWDKAGFMKKLTDEDKVFLKHLWQAQ